MIFNAKMNLALSSEIGTKDSDKMRRELLKMTKKRLKNLIEILKLN